MGPAHACEGLSSLSFEHFSLLKESTERRRQQRKSRHPLRHSIILKCGCFISFFLIFVSNIIPSVCFPSTEVACAMDALVCRSGRRKKALARCCHATNQWQHLNKNKSDRRGRWWFITNNLVAKHKKVQETTTAHNK